MKCISFKYQGFSLSYFIAAPHVSLFPLGHFIVISYLPCCDISFFPSPFFIVSLGTFHCCFISTLLQYFILSQPIFHWTFHCYFISTLLRYFIISQPIFHCFPWDISLVFHIYPAAIFHYFPTHFSLFSLGHFISISYLPCCDISLFPSPFFIVSLGTFHCYFIFTLLRYFIIFQPIFHYFPWDISLLFHIYPTAIFHYFPAHFSLFPLGLFHICPAAIFHSFPDHFSLFFLGHFIAISYLSCCDISLFTRPFFIVSLGTFLPGTIFIMVSFLSRQCLS